MIATSRLNNIIGHLQTAKDASSLSSSLAMQQTSAAMVESPMGVVGMKTMVEERKSATFDIRKMTYILLNGKDNVERWEKVTQQLERDPIFQNDMYDVPHKQHREVVYSRVKRMMDYRLVDDIETWIWRRIVTSVIDPSLDVRMAVHTTLFREAVAQNGTPEQLQKWLPDIDSYKIPGCFAMTELGHGSYIQGFETTATYDPKTDEFVINTPTDTATKWWIGGAAHSALACVCYARLIIDGKDYGVYNFFVPLRRRVDFANLPGITIGDCGAKIGRHGIDNGWIQFNHVRIPRENMLMKWAKVDRDGKFTQSPSIQLSYGALIGGRVSITSNAGVAARKALTIAIRYSAIRRQFLSDEPEKKKTKMEQQILDYTTTMYRLMPLLSECYALHFAAMSLDRRNKMVQEEVKKGELKNLNDLHATSAGMKAFSTWFTLDAIEQCRQSLGGHGFSAYSGIGAWGNDFLVNVTWEGDNTVMSLQTARYLLKAISQAFSGKTVGGTASFLNNFQTILGSKFQPTTEAELRDSSAIIAAFEYLCTKRVCDAALRISELVKQGQSQASAFNATAVDLKDAAKAYYYLFVVRSFADAVEQNKKDDENVGKALKLLCDLFCFYHLKQNMAVFLEDNYISAAQAKVINQLTVQACKDVRVQAIPFTDAFNFSDFHLRSPLARYDGNIYTAYFNRVKQSPESQGRPYYWGELVDKVLHKHLIPKEPF